MQCYHTERDKLGFYTDCEWKALAFFEAMFLIFFLIIILPYHLWLKKFDCVCGECLCARNIIFWIKAILYAIFEIANKFLERPLYDLIHCFEDNSTVTLFLCVTLHYVNVSVLIKFSKKTSVFTLITISSP